MKWENKLSDCTYSASRLVDKVPGPISPGYRPFAPLALRKTCPNSLAIEQVDHGYTATRHQREVGAGYFDEVSVIISGGESSTTALHGSTESKQINH